jgi:hypothetical protein
MGTDDPGGRDGLLCNCLRIAQAIAQRQRSAGLRRGLTRQILVLHLPGVVHHVEGGVTEEERKDPRLHPLALDDGHVMLPVGGH